MGAVDTILEAVRADLAAISGLDVEVYQSAPFQPPEAPTSAPYAACAISYDGDGDDADPDKTYSWSFKALAVAIRLYVVDDAADVKGLFDSMQAQIESALRGDWTLSGNVIAVEFEPGWGAVREPGDREEMGVRPEMSADFGVTVRYVVNRTTGALVTS